MDISIVFSLVAITISAVSVLVAYFSMKEQKKATQNAAGFTYLVSAELLIERHPELFELHNIDSKLMEECGVTDIELLYLMESFTSSDLYHRIGGDKSIELTEYRKNLLRNPKVQIAWKRIIRHKLLSHSRYCEAIDTYIEQHPSHQLATQPEAKASSEI